MINCPNCGSKLNGNEFFCGTCGAKIIPQGTNDINNVTGSNFNKISSNQNNIETRIDNINNQEEYNMQNNSLKSLQINNNIEKNNIENFAGNEIPANISNSQNLNNEMNSQMSTIMENNKLNKGMSNQMSSVMPTDNFNNENYQSNNQNDNQINSVNYSDEELIDAYIGKNSSNLKNGGFSFNTLFLGITYVLYRKMWLLGIIWFLLTIFIFPIIPKLSLILGIITNIIISIFFKKWYIKDAKEKIEKIKSSNPKDSPQQLLEKCRKKGGTTYIPVIIVIVLGLLFVILAIFAFVKIKDTFIENLETENHNNNKGIKEELKFKVSREFEEIINDDNYIYYSLMDYKKEENNNCKIVINKEKQYSMYKSPEEYIKSRVTTKIDDQVSQIEKRNINNNIWTTVSVKNNNASEYYYVIFNNNNIYEVKYEIFSDTGKCTKEKDELINSLEFK